MRLNVDAELQHLISVSIEKLTTGHSDPTCARRGDRKSRSIDLRKALFVAHVLQEVRCAYLEDDYEIVANTVSDTRSSKCNWEAEIREINYDTVKDVNERCIEESHTYLMETDTTITDASSPSSPSVLQSCVTNADVTVSRISQVTRPVSVSINTAHVMSFQRLTELSSVEERNDDSPVVCEELDLSHCCEVVSSAPDDDNVPRETEAESRERLSGVNRMQADRGSAAAETATRDIGSQNTHEEARVLSSGASTSPCDRPEVCKANSRCPLPKKKRPLPKEFLDDATSCEVPTSKSAKSDRLEESSLPVQTSCVYSSTSTVTLESRTSTSISTVYSTIGTAPSFSTVGVKRQPTPKVVVQLTQSCDAFRPITCSQLSQRLGELSAFSLPHSALA